jgi:cytoskeletal protein CcmA (bactofilin family)
MESPMAEVRIKDIDEHEIDTILAEDIDFEGHLTFKKPLMIKGKFKGEIKSSSSLYIGEKAFVEATTEAAVVSSKGSHKGNIVGHSRVELFSSAQVDGDITTPDFVVESGCKFNGYCNMGGVPQKDGARPVHPPQPASQPSSPNAGTQQPPLAPAQQPQRPQSAPQNPAQNQQQNPAQNQQQTQHNQQQNQQQKPGAPSQGSGGQQR